MNSKYDQAERENIKKCIYLSDDVDKYGIPNWEIFDLTRYNENIHINKASHALPIMASRGCLYKCDFCSTHLTWGTTVRYRSPHLVFNEIKKEIEKYNISDYHFYDDNLLFSDTWMDEFLWLIEKERLKFNWICLSRPEIICKNRHLLERMKKCGCKGFELGFETQNEDLYNNMNKKIKKQLLLKLIIC